MTEENVFKQATEKETKQKEMKSPLHQSEFSKGIIKDWMVEDMVIKRGLAADIPDGSSHVLAYFETDTNKLKIWNGSAWKSTTLS